MMKEQWARVQADACRVLNKTPVPKATRTVMINYIVALRVLGKSGRSETLMRKQYQALPLKDLRWLYGRIYRAMERKHV